MMILEVWLEISLFFALDEKFAVYLFLDFKMPYRLYFV
ncbi:hypothetical protein AXX16_0236 [Serratia rubidaea]|nr:hypothetical protein AXX16_0236 [Serratia rubidaea]